VNFERDREKSEKTGRKTYIFFDKQKKTEKTTKNKELPICTQLFKVVYFPQVSAATRFLLPHTCHSPRFVNLPPD
jgi:hypothetical protein